MDPHRIARFADHLTDGVRRAASIARSLEGRVPNRPKRSEPTLVKQALTDADSLAQEALLEALQRHFPEVCEVVIAFDLVYLGRRVQ